MRTGLLMSALVTCAVAVGTDDAIAAGMGETVLLSGPSGAVFPPLVPLGYSYPPASSVSQHGRYVAFVSTSDGLMDGDDDGVQNGYVRDMQTGTLTALNVASDGTAGRATLSDVAIASGEASPPKVAFVTAARLTADDTNDTGDLYVRDLSTGTVTLVGRADGAAGAPSGQVYDIDMSTDGTTVAWTTPSSLTAADTVPDSVDVYVRKLATNTTTWESRREAGGGPSSKPVGTPFAASPALSPSGDAVAFSSDAVDLDAAATDTNGVNDAFVTPIGSLTMILASAKNGTTATAGSNATRGQILRGSSPAWTVLFGSDASDLVAGDTDTTTDAFRRTVNTTTTEMVSLNDADGPTNAQVFVADATPDANTILLRCLSICDLFSGDANEYATDEVLRVRTGPGLGTTRLVSRGDGAAGAQAGGESNGGSLSDDGDWLAYSTESPVIARGAESSRAQVVRRQLSGTQLNTPVSFDDTTPEFNPGGEGRLAGPHAVSADGRYAVVIAEGAAMSDADAPGDTRTEAYRRDLLTGETVLVSRDDGPNGAPPSESVRGAAISADGSLVIWADDDVKVRDLKTQTTRLVSRLPSNAPDLQSGHQIPDISADGRRVAWTSRSDLTGTGDATGEDVFVRDLATDAVTLVSRGDGNGPDGDGSSNDPLLDATGNRVVFRSNAANLGDGDADSSSDIHLRDLAANRTSLIDKSSSGAKADSAAYESFISADGHAVAFTTQAGNLDPAAPGGGSAVFLHDLNTATTRLVSRDGPSGPVLLGDVGAPRLSSDASVMAWVHYGYVGAPAGTSQALLRSESSAPEVVSRATGAAGLIADGDVESVALDADGSCVAFDSRATNLIAAPISADVLTAWMRVRGAGCPDPAPVVTPAPGPAPGPVPPAAKDTTRPAISKLKLSRTTFRVSAKATAVSAAARRKRTAAGTSIGFRLSETAKVTLLIERRTSGRKVGKRCLKATSKLRKRKACTRYVKLGTLTRKAVKPGAVKIAFSGRIGKKALKSGRYRLSVGARDVAGNAATTRRVTFRVVKR